jgi:hypothetical protein
LQAKNQVLEEQLKNAHLQAQIDKNGVNSRKMGYQLDKYRVSVAKLLFMYQYQTIKS